MSSAVWQEVILVREYLKRKALSCIGRAFFIGKF